MSIKTKALEGGVFLHYHYTVRKRDSENKILPLLASNNAIVTSETLVKLPDGTEVNAEPIIVLLEAPSRSFPFRVHKPRISFKTGVFLHPVLFEDYIKTGNSTPDSQYLFELNTQGLNITDLSKSKTNAFNKEALKSFGIISLEWDYLDKAQRWFESDFKSPTGVKPSGYFLTDIGKIPTRLIDGNVAKNSDVWVM